MYPQDVSGQSQSSGNVVLSAMDIGDVFQLASVGIDNLSIDNPHIGYLKARMPNNCCILSTDLPLE